MADNYAAIAATFGTSAVISKASKEIGGVHHDKTVPLTSGTATRTVVAASATVVTLLAANAARLGAVIYNDGSNDLRVGLGAVAATATNFTARLAIGTSYEVPAGYTGAITGIWGATPTGSAYITELTI